MPRISVVICTWNRASYLTVALESLRWQTLAENEFEVVVVDNGSTDGTREAVETLRRTWPELHLVHEPRLGLSFARNAGAQAATSPYVAYLDDDARAEPDWLEGLLACFDRVSAPPAAVGGRVWLDWEGGRPAWLPSRFQNVYTFVDHGDTAHPLQSGEHLVGANLAVRKDVLLGIGGFDPRLGRRGSLLLSGEEADLLARVAERGKVYYAPATVWHLVSPERRRQSWLWKRVFWDGASQPLLDGRNGSKRSAIRKAGYEARQCGALLIRSFVCLWRGDREAARGEALASVQRAGRCRTQFLLAVGRLG